MNAAGRWAWVVLLLASCGDPAPAPGSKAAALKKQDPAPAAATTPAPAPAPTKPGGKQSLPPTPAKIAEILVDLARWDAATKEERREAGKEVVKRATEFELLRFEPFTCGGQTHEVAVFKHGRTEMEFVLVPGGTFDMGSPESEKGRQVFENLHGVTLTRPFLIARTECTQATWKRVMEADPSKVKGDDRPVEMVSWEEAQMFCEKMRLSLPTEAQWERACRAGTTTRFYHGDDVESLGDYAWFAAEGAPKVAGVEPESMPVGKKAPNAFGLFDMLGNVSEWCADMMNPYPTSAVTDPFTAIDAEHKSPVYRGGSYRRPDVVSRAAFRLSLDADSHDSTIGFRPARTIALD